MYALSSFSPTTPVTYATQLQRLTSIFWPNPSSSPFFTPFVICNKIKAQTQLDVDRFRLEKIKKRIIECLVRVCLKELNVDKEAREAAEEPAKNLTPLSL